MLLTVSVVLFAIGAAFGITMATLHFMGRSPPPFSLAILHGVFVIGGFAMLWGALWPAFDRRETWALGLFALAALGGTAMVLGWRTKPPPSALVLAHGGAALFAFAVLLAGYFAL
jgi:hypothetical protein